MPNLSGNVTMARKGLGKTAITACFARPVFNILVGLGCRFGVVRHTMGNQNHYVYLTLAIRTGFVFCFINCSLLLVNGLVINKGVIPSGYGTQL
jgi:sodium/potassium/calcium exchanger 6